MQRDIASRQVADRFRNHRGPVEAGAPVRKHRNLRVVRNELGHLRRRQPWMLVAVEDHLEPGTQPANQVVVVELDLDCFFRLAVAGLGRHGRLRDHGLDFAGANGAIDNHRLQPRGQAVLRRREHRRALVRGFERRDRLVPLRDHARPRIGVAFGRRGRRLVDRRVQRLWILGERLPHVFIRDDDASHVSTFRLSLPVPVRAWAVVSLARRGGLPRPAPAPAAA